MGWGRLFLTANGRVGRSDFWIAWFLLVIVSAVLKMFGVIGDLLGILIVYPQVCLFAKRLHDLGKSGWWTTLVFGLLAAAAALSGVSQGLEAGAGADAAATVQFATAFMLAGCAIAGVGLFFRTGLSRGQPEANAYGALPVPILRRFRRERVAT